MKKAYIIFGTVGGAGALLLGQTMITGAPIMEFWHGTLAAVLLGYFLIGQGIIPTGKEVKA